MQESENFRRNFEVQIENAEVQWAACENEARSKLHGLNADVGKLQKAIDGAQEGYKGLLNNNKEIREQT